MAIEKLATAEIINTASLNDFEVDENLKDLAPIIGEDDKRGMIETIKKEGLLEPISVHPEKANGKWRIVDGFQRFALIRENKLLKEIPFRIRGELRGKTDEELADWIKVNAGNRRHLNKYQKVFWVYEKYGRQLYEEAAERMKAGKKDPVVTVTTRSPRTEDCIVKNYGVSQKALRLYRKILELWDSPDRTIRKAATEIHEKLLQEQIGWDDAKAELSKLDEKPERKIKERGPKLFKIIGPEAADLDYLIVMVEQAKEQGEIELDRDYVPEFRLRLPTDTDYKKGNVYIGEKIGGTIDKKAKEEKELLESLPKTVDKPKENRELKAKGVAQRVKHLEQEREMDKGISRLPSLTELKRMEKKKQKPPKNKVSKVSGETRRKVGNMSKG